jgi:hypothetical protein
MASRPQLFTLVPHPSTPAGAVRRLTVSALREPPDALRLDYRLTGDLERIAVPAPRVSVRADELWRHTCFEAFIARAAGAGYHELNFSPSGEWASYRFGGYRARAAAEPEDAAPELRISQTSGELSVRAVIRPPELRGADLQRLALAAVIEDRDGNLSYWALQHPPGKPDFHHPHGFVLEI